MARIKSADRGELTRVTIAGRLTGRDMGRLEHACSRALASHPIHLELDLRQVTYLDSTAQAVLRQLAHRGARIHPPNQQPTPGLEP
jgi:anti-anti-sigma regulatory factor